MLFYTGRILGVTGICQRGNSLSYFILFLNVDFFIIFNVCVHVHVHAGACRVQKRALDLPQLELWVVMSCLTWVQGTELWFS